MWEPKYEQIAEWVRESLLAGELAPGDRLPSSRKLAEHWQVSRATAVKALHTLCGEGLVERRRTAQFVVADPAAAPAAAGRGVATGPRDVGLRLSVAQALLKHCTPLFDVADSPHDLWSKMHPTTRREWLLRAGMVLDQLAADGIDVRSRQEGPR